MPKCEKCDKEFDLEEVEWEFEQNIDANFPVSYERLERMLCIDCAEEEFYNGNYYEYCEICGKKFYPLDDEREFENLVSHKISDADMYDEGIVCAECAAKILLDSLEDDEDEVRPCPECGGCLHWDGEVWECSNCDYTEED